MIHGSKWKRVALGLSLFLVVTGAFLALLGPRLLGGWIDGRVRAELVQRGDVVTYDTLALSASTARLTDVCLQDGDLVFGCVDEVEVGFTRPGMFSTDITPTSILVSGGNFDFNSERGTLAELGDRAQSALMRMTGRDSAAEPTGTPRAAAPRARRELPSIQIRSLTVDASGQGFPFARVSVEQGDVAQVEGTWTVTSALRWEGLELPDGVEVGEQMEFNAMYTGMSEWSASVRPAGGIRATYEGLSASVSGVSFTWPYFFGIEEVMVTSDAQETPLATIPSATLELRELATSLDDLFIASLELSHPVFHAVLGADGRPVALAPFLNASDDPDPSGDAAEPAEEGSGEVAAAEEGSGAVDAEAPAALWEDRRWWEKIPQEIRLTQATARVTNSDGSRGIEWTELDLAYALRVLNFQADVNLSGNLASLGGEPAAQTMRLTFGWTTNHLNADINLQRIPVGTLLSLATGGTVPFTGELDLSWHIEEQPRTGRRSEYVCTVNTQAQFAIRNLMVIAPMLRAPFTVESFTGDVAAGCSEEDPGYLEFERGDFELDGARFSVRPRLSAFDYQAALPFDHAVVRFDVPEQPAQRVFEAIPGPLRAMLEGTSMEGDFGFGLDFEFDVVRDDDGWLRPENISSATRWDVDDSGVSLMFLPSAVDVRRMNGPMNFIFHGPNNSFERPMTVPAPRPTHDAGLEGPAPEDLGQVRNWVRLDEMSYYLVAMQLYREDGRFFENNGVNWFQLRRVIEEAFAERQLGRGASTISMQLIKNVFLTHERSIERKFTELFLTYWMTRLVPKERILETYLNVIEWGPNTNGIVEASNYYFDKEPVDLTFAEATWLAAITPAPARRAPQREMGTPPDWMMRQVHDLMRGLHSRGLVSQRELNEGLNQEIRFVTHPEFYAAREAAERERLAQAEAAARAAAFPNDTQFVHSGNGLAAPTVPSDDNLAAHAGLQSNLRTTLAVGPPSEPDAFGLNVAPLSPDEVEESEPLSAFLSLSQAARIRHMIANSRATRPGPHSGDARAANLDR